ncbi:MAG: hypothetical protein JSW25_00825, partial [Thermoplasmata archaeon]
MTKTTVYVLTVMFIVPSLLAVSATAVDGVPDVREVRSVEDRSGKDDLLYGTLFGGASIESNCFVDVDASGNVYLAGSTLSSEFPTTVGAYDVSPNGHYDVFAMKLSADGIVLEFSTLIGGSISDMCQAMVVDASGHMYIAGYTLSSDFPTTDGAYGEAYTAGPNDLFVLRLDPTGSSLEYSTYLGGEGTEHVGDICLDGSGNLFLTGETDSVYFPTTEDAYDSTMSGEEDCFITKLSPDGSSLVYSTFVGGNKMDLGDAIEVDAQGRAVVAGVTWSTRGFHVSTDAYDNDRSGASDGFVLRLSADGTDVVMSTL